MVGLTTAVPRMYSENVVGLSGAAEQRGWGFHRMKYGGFALRDGHQFGVAAQVATDKYSDIDIDTLFEMYLAAEGKEEEAMAEDLYKRGEVLCTQIYWWRFRDIPLAVADELYHDSWIEILQKGKVGGSFRGFLSKVFTHRSIGWLRKKEVRRRHLARSRSGLRKEPSALLPDGTLISGEALLQEELEQTLDCIETLPGRQRRIMKL